MPPPAALTDRSPSETQRLHSLARYLSAAESDHGLLNVARLAADLFDAPMALATFVDMDRVRFVAREGITQLEMPRISAFCSTAIAQDDPLVVPDALTDERFNSNPLVAGEPYVRFYAGQPLVTPDGDRLGTLCILDTKPRPALNAKEQRLLGQLANFGMERLEASRATAEANRAHSQLQAALNELPEGIAFFDADRRFTMWNRRYAEMYRLAADVLAPGLPFETFLRTCIARGQLPEAVGNEEAWLAQRLELNDQPEGSYERRMPGGRWLKIEERRMPDGGRIGIRVDITDLKRREASFRFLFEGNPVPMWIYDRETLRFLAVNDAMLRHYSFAREQVLSMSALDIRPPEERDQAADAMRHMGSAYEPDRTWRHLKADGSEIQVIPFARALLYDGRESGLVAAIDVTERVRAQSQIAHMAHHDSLTNLPNRVLLRQRLEEALGNRRSERSGKAAVLLLDLDRFKHVNDTLGHGVGDALLTAVAERLGDCVRDGDTVARLGGDEFVIVLPHVAAPGDVDLVATRVIRLLTEPFLVSQHDVSVGVSLGVALAPNDGADPDTLLKNADIALYRAKEEARGTYRFFEPTMDLAMQLRRALEMDLRQALREQQFELHYQPLVDVRANTVTGFEALLRWRHPERGLIAPGDFIAFAEETGLIGPIGDWVLRQACLDAMSWPKDVKVAVNLSPAQVRDDLVGVVEDALASSGLSGCRLEVEITESVLLHENERTLAILHRLRALGVRVSLDDFGKGYSSLSYLRSFPFDKIKIDGSFIQNLDQEQSLIILAAVVRLAASLKIETTAECVETSEQLDKVRAEGCTEVQGFFLGRPGPASTVRSVINLFRSRRRTAA